MTNHLEEMEFINSVVESFYDDAKTDIIIGYHFRHIKNFNTHIPKIQRFWYLILLDLSPQQKKEIQSKGTPKNVILSHQYLKIKPGEVGRWVTLFNAVLDRNTTVKHLGLTKNWKSEIDKFQKIFLKSPVLFS